MNDFDYVANLNIDVNKPIFIITHGYMEGGSIDWVCKAYLMFFFWVKIDNML